MGANKKSCTPKYRQEAAHLVIDTQRTIAAVARDIGVGEALLGRWVAIERARMDDPPRALERDLRVHRDLPQPSTPALGPGLPHPDRIRTTLREDTPTRLRLIPEGGNQGVGQVTLSPTREAVPSDTRRGRLFDCVVRILDAPHPVRGVRLRASHWTCLEVATTYLRYIPPGQIGYRRHQYNRIDLRTRRWGVSGLNRRPTDYESVALTD